MDSGKKVIFKNMRRLLISYSLFLLAVINFTSCQKELEGVVNPPVVKNTPKVGTTWLYRYVTYYSWGAPATTEIVQYTISKIDTIAGEPWFNVIDKNGNTVWLYSVRPTGLFEYTNSSAQLLCKDPAYRNEKYTTWRNGGMEDFKVIGVKDTLVMADKFVVNYYEGEKLLNTTSPPQRFVLDKIWYNDEVWIAKHEFWDKTSLFSSYYKRSSFELQQITY